MVPLNSARFRVHHAVRMEIRVIRIIRVQMTARMHRADCSAHKANVVAIRWVVFTLVQRNRATRQNPVFPQHFPSRHNGA